MNGLLELETNALGDEIALESLPSIVRKAVDKAVPGGKWESATCQTVYELEGTDAKGRAVVVEVNDDGEVGEVSTETSVMAVPSAVVSALKSKLPRFAVQSVFESRHGGKVVGYSFEGRRPRDKEDVGVFVSVDGKTIEIDEGR
jgi:hypothetical protein